MLKQKSVVNHNFGVIPVSKMPRSVFNRSQAHATCFDSDYLVPLYVDQGILPGDTVSCKFNVLVRTLSATLKPLMDNIKGSIYTFFVPHRLVWTNFVKHMGERDNPADSISYNIPTVPTPNGAAGGVAIGDFYDYCGVPTEAAGLGGAGVASQSIANLVGRSYHKIWNDHFRHQQIQDSVTLDVDDGPDTYSDYSSLLKIGKKFDYFVSCLPNPQMGSTAVDLPLGTSAPVLGISKATQTFPQSSVAGYDSGGNNPTYTYAAYVNYGASVNNEFTIDGTAAANGYPNIYADLSSATAATINSLRESITLQQFLERDARSGTRYVEIVKSHFAGVVVPDFRAQRSEIIHIFNFDVRLNPVAQTSASGIGAESTYQGDLTAFGTGVGSDHYTHTFVEHGTLMSLICIRGEVKYHQGLDRFWSKSTRYDHYWPQLANLGEQAVYNKEIYWALADGTASNQKDGVWGYLPRYDEYRHNKHLITGLLRPYVTGTLGIWNLAENFSAQPTLGSTFIQSNTPMDRAVAVPSAPHFMVDSFCQIKHARIMPVFAVPGLKRL